MSRTSRVALVLAFGLLSAAPLAAYGREGSDASGTKLNELKPTVVTPAKPAQATTPKPPAFDPSDPRTCTILRSLKRGSSGSDVSVLQQLLAQDPEVYPSREITGYFGNSTVAAVQAFQKKLGIATSGDAASTGFGAVGPATRDALSRYFCPPQTGSTTFSLGVPFSLSSGQTARQANGRFTVRLDSLDSSKAQVALSLPCGTECAATTNGTSATSVLGGRSKSATLSTGQSIEYAGFTATLTSLAKLTATFVVTSASSSNATSTPSNIALSANPNSGAAPLSVAFSASGLSSEGRYGLSYGDGSASSQFTGNFQGDSKNPNPWSHTYSSSGTYNATLTSYPIAQTNCANCPQQRPSVVATAQVVVSARSGAHEAIEASPSSGAAPLTVTFSTWVGGLRLPSTDIIDYGDGTSEQTAECPAPADACTAPGTNTHTYTRAGKYTATLYHYSGANKTGTRTTRGAVKIEVGSSSSTLGTYAGYLDGSKFIETEDISEADALANCKLNASQNPGRAVRCTWNGREIFSTVSNAAPTPVIAFGASATLVGSGLPVTLSWSAAPSIGCSLSDGSIGLSASSSKTFNPTETTPYVLTCTNVSAGAATSSASKMVKVTVSKLPVISSTASAADLRGKNGQKFSYFCAPGAAAGSAVWGTSVYTDDSSICMAAVHAGVVTDAGGPVTITISGKRSSFTGTRKNGVTSSSWGAWDGSFTVAQGPIAEADRSRSVYLASVVSAFDGSLDAVLEQIGQFFNLY